MKRTSIFILEEEDNHFHESDCGSWLLTSSCVTHCHLSPQFVHGCLGIDRLWPSPALRGYVELLFETLRWCRRIVPVESTCTMTSFSVSKSVANLLSTAQAFQTSKLWQFCCIQISVLAITVDFSLKLWLYSTQDGLLNAKNSHMYHESILINSTLPNNHASKPTRVLWDFHCMRSMI